MVSQGPGAPPTLGGDFTEPPLPTCICGKNNHHEIFLGARSTSVLSHCGSDTSRLWGAAVGLSPAPGNEATAHSRAHRHWLGSLFSGSSIP